MRHFNYFHLALLLFAGFACKNGPDMLKPYGKDATVTRKLESFSTLDVGQKFTVYLTWDTNQPEQISITYSENLLDKVVAEVADGRLKVRDKNHYNWVRKLDVKPRCIINLHQLHALEINGAAEIICLDSLRPTHLDLTMNSVGEQRLLFHAGVIAGSASNTGHIYFNGIADILTFSCEDGSWFDGRNMLLDDAYIWYYSPKDCYVNPTNIFEAYVYGLGNVYYYQTPIYKFKPEAFGKGKVLKY